MAVRFVRQVRRTHLIGGKPVGWSELHHLFVHLPQDRGDIKVSFRNDVAAEPGELQLSQERPIPQGPAR